MVDDQAADPTQEEGQQETNQLVVIQKESPPFSSSILIVTVCSSLSRAFAEKVELSGFTPRMSPSVRQTGGQA